LETLKGPLTDATFNVEIDTCFIVFLGSRDMFLQATFLRNRFFPPFNGQTNQFLPAINLRATCVNQALVEDRFARKFSGQARKCDSGSL
jgi:hypothetical protein